MTQTIERKLEFSQSPAEVWRALTDPTLLAKWMYPNDFEPRVGRRFTFQVPPNPQADFDGTVRCEVLECIPQSRLVFTWSASNVSTRTSYRLEPDGAGTRVLFEQSGFEHEQAFKGAEYGWTLMHGKLAELLDAAE